MRASFVVLCLTACHPPWPLDDSDPGDSLPGDSPPGDSTPAWDAPEIAFTFPGDDGARFWEGVGATLRVKVSDEDGDLDHVAFESDLQGGLGWGFDMGEGNFALDVSLQSGAHQLTARAFDTAAHEGTDEAEVSTRSCSPWAGQIPCRWSFDALSSSMSVVSNDNTAWSCRGTVYDANGDPASLELEDGVYDVAPLYRGDGRSIAVELPTGVGAGTWTLQLWFRGDASCQGAGEGYPLLSLVAADPVTDDLRSVSILSTGTTTDLGGVQDMTEVSVLQTAWADGAWHVLALSNDATGVLHGSLDGTANEQFKIQPTVPVAFPGGTLRFGGSPDGKEAYCGQLDDLAFSIADVNDEDFAWTWQADTAFCLGTP